MTIVHVSDLPEDVREHLAMLEREGDEFPEGFAPAEASSVDSEFSDEE